jgi:cytochrome c biogenesis protein CcdA
MRRPALAAIVVAGATGNVDARTIALTPAFAVGATLPLLAFALAGQRVAEWVSVFRRRQRAEGAVHSSNALSGRP